MGESPKQLIEIHHGTIAMKPGKKKRQDFDYIRHGVVNVFRAGEPLRGKHHVEVRETKTKRDWALFVEQIANKEYPKATKIRLVPDNLKHTPAAFHETFPPEKAKSSSGPAGAHLHTCARLLAQHG